MNRIYLDHSATTRPDPLVIEAMLPIYREYFGNPSSLHSFGRDARKALNEAREKVAGPIGAKASEIIFTSGGTESDNLAIMGAAMKNRRSLKEHPDGPHIITTPTEHPAIGNTCKHLESLGFKVKYLPVDRYGMIDPGDLAGSITEATFLVTVIYANNEIGTIQPMEELGRITRERGILLHTDAVQAYGKIPIDVKRDNIDMLSLSSHKIYGPKGVGALYVRKGVRLDPIVHGGGHERGLRPSSENVPGIVGLAKAAELADERMESDTLKLIRLRDRLIEGVLGRIEQSALNGHPERRLPNNAHFRFTAIEGEALLLSLDNEGIAASTGSACSSKSLEPSKTLLATGLNPVEAHGSLRLTLGRETTDEEIDRVLVILPEIVERLRALSPLWGKDLDLEKWKNNMEGHHHS